MKKTFAYHKPSAASLDALAKLRVLFSTAADEMERLCPKSRELSVALTHIETAAMWANKAVTHNDPESVVVE